MKALLIKSESDMLAIGMKIAQLIGPGVCLALYGELGAGKTTLVRGILRGLGFQGAVKSPTYTLVETYTFDDFNFHHFDWYRLIDPEELEYIGIRDYFNASDINVIEWPEKGGAYLPNIDVNGRIFIFDTQRKMEFDANSEKGLEIVKGLEVKPE